MYKKIILTTLFMLIGCMTAFAANWVEAGKKSYIDVSSMKIDSYNKRVRVWSKMLNTNVNTDLFDGKKWHYQINYELFDCSENMYKLLSGNTYDLKGEPIDMNTWYELNSWDYVIPGSRTEAIYKKTCEYAFGR